MCDKNKPIIKATTPNSKKYDTKVDIYTNDPKSKHESIHIAINSDNKTAHIIDTTSGKTEHTDVGCYLTTACMKHFMENFDDNCDELKTLRWFRDNFVTKDDIKHYYEIAPIIVKQIEKMDSSDKIYSYIYNNIVKYCVEAIKNGNYKSAYDRYKNSVIVLEEQFARPSLEARLSQVLRLTLNKKTFKNTP